MKNLYRIITGITVLIFYPYFAAKNRKNQSTLLNKAQVRKISFKDAA